MLTGLQEAQSAGRREEQLLYDGADFAHRAAYTAAHGCELMWPRTVERVAEARLPTEEGEFCIVGYRLLTSSEEFVALEVSPANPAMSYLLTKKERMGHLLEKV